MGAAGVLPNWTNHGHDWCGVCGACACLYVYVRVRVWVEGCTTTPALRSRPSMHCRLAAGETVILLQPPLPLVGVATGMERGRRRNGSLANGYARKPAEPVHPHL